MSNKPLELTTENFDNTVNNGKISLIDFWAEWCGPCVQQTPIIVELAESVSDTYNICKVDVDSNQEIAAKYQITSIPALLIFKDGEEVKRLVGLHPKNMLEEELKAVAQA